MAQWFPDFQRLLEDFGRLEQLARQLGPTFPDEEHDTLLAMVGFSLQQPIESWGLREYTRLRRRLEQELSEGSHSRGWVAFTSLAMGYTEGLRSAGSITEDELRHADTVLSGFMHLNSAKIDRLVR